MGRMIVPKISNFLAVKIKLCNKLCCFYGDTTELSTLTFLINYFLFAEGVLGTFWMHENGF